MIKDSEYKENTFEDFFSDAIAQIPLLNSDWTNFNASDPGITILENLTAFQVLQQSYIYEISEKQKEVLLSLAGISAHHGKAARVYLSPEPLEKNIILPSYQKFLVGDLCFENNNPIKIGNNRITDIFLKDGEKIYEKNELINREIPVSSYIWGENPKENLEMYIVMNSLDNFSDELLVYINIDETYKRNDFTFKKENPFAKIRWQLYTENGYLDIKVKDNSECFLRDGAIRFLIPKGKAALYCHHGFSGYVIRGTLIKASYDIPPKLSLISGFLFEAWQKESKALTFTFKGNEIIDIHCNMLDLGYVQVYCQEDEAKSYHLYNECINYYDKGRYYEKICLSPGIYRFIFSKERFGYVPCNANNAIKIVVYNNETMRQYYLGQVLGYDNQTIKLPFRNIISDSFSVIVKSKDDNNEDVYSFAKEGKESEDSLYYLLDEDSGTMTIADAGKYINSQIYIASIAITEGDAGNIEKNRPFVCDNSNIRLTNVSNGIGGHKKESIEELQSLFIKRVNEHDVAVTAMDYEIIASKTPGLCINKVKAIFDQKTKDVNLVVIPYSNSNRPTLSETYIQIIHRHIEKYRLLSTKVNILSAVYVPVDVYVSLDVRPNFSNCEQQINNVICDMLDYSNTEYGIGDRLHYEKIYNELRKIDGVETIRNLKLNIKNEQYAKKQELDIVPASNCVLYLGNVTIETAIVY